MGARLLLGILREVGTAMTGRAGLRGDRWLRVIHGCGRPGNIAALVTGITLLGNLNVSGRHWQRILACIGRIMAAGTLTNRHHMVHLGRLEGNKVLVAIGTLLCPCRDVSAGDTKSRRSVMASRAFAIGTRIMSIGNTRPGRCRAVAGIALRRCRYVGCRLGQGVLRRVAAAVTGRTLADRASMVHGGRSEGRESGMTGIAIASGRDMRTRLGQPLIGRPVVARITAMVTNNGWR